MADGLTTPRKLEQVKWERGVTDGDIRAGFVRELTNVDMDEPGRLRARDSLVDLPEHPYLPSLHGTRYFHMHGDPSSFYDSGWSFFVGTQQMWIYPFGEDTQNEHAGTFNLPFTDLDLNTVEVAFIGSTVYIASQNTSGVPNTVIAMSWVQIDGKFSAPEYVPEGDDLYGQTNDSGKWRIIALNERPILTVAMPTNSFGAPGNGFGSKSSRLRDLSSLSQQLANGPIYSVGLYAEGQRKDSVDYRELGYTGGLSINVVAVFAFADGSISLPSNEHTIRIDIDDVDATMDLALSVVVNEDIHDSISQVRIYRKIVSGNDTGSDLFDFLFSATIYDVDIHEDTGSTSSIDQFERAFSKGGGWFITDETQIEDLYRSTEEVTFGVFAAYDGSQANARPYSAYKMVDPVTGIAKTYRETAGWIKPQPGWSSRLYMPVHFYNEGNLVVRQGIQVNDSNSTGYVEVTYLDSIRVTDRYNIGDDDWGVFNNDFKFAQAIIVGCKVMLPQKLTYYGGGGADQSLLYASATSRADGVSYANGVQYAEFHGGRGVFKSGAVDSHTYGNVGINPTYTHGIITDLIDEEPGIATTFAMFRDNAFASPFPGLEEEFGGASLDSLTDVNPRHIGIAGGRLFGLNISEDGEIDSSKLVYSEFGKFASFRKDNYFDYGVRDDGHGVAVSTIKSYVIAHHTSSTYVFDVASGSDLVWREVGAFYDVGCLGPNTTATTPYGVFWCDRSGVWSYGGNRPESISAEIVRIYREMVDTIYRVLYNEKLKQLWLMSTTGITLVYDLERGAWHSHELTEFEINEKRVFSLFSVGNESHLNYSSETHIHQGFKAFDRNAEPDFAWSIDTGEMDMGIPEVVKKIRRLYINTLLDYDETQRIKIEAVGDVSGNVLIDEPLVDGGQLRMSASVRGYHVRFKLTVERGWSWRGSLNSLGISYKQKKLK